VAIDTSNNQAPRHSISQIQVAIEALMTRLSGGRVYDASLAARIAGSIQGAVNDPNNALDNLNGNPAFERMVTEQAPKLSETVNDPAAKLAAAKAEQARANVTGAPLSEGARAALGFNRFADARSDGAGARSGERSTSSANYSRELSAASVYKSLAAEGYSAAQVTSAMNFAKSIGVNDNAYAGYFVGSSKHTRDAISAHIKDGKKITDDDVEKPEDVAAIVGAVKAGKMKPEEAPPSVRKIIEDMKKDGVDPATAPPKAIHKYLKEHPKALEAAKKEVKAEVKAREGLTEQQKQKQNEAIEKQHGATQAPASTASTAVAAVTARLFGAEPLKRRSREVASMNEDRPARPKLRMAEESASDDSHK
jgi:hypothetical protein